MANEHIKALKQVIKGRTTLPILKCIAHSDGKLMATDLTVMVQIDTPNIMDGIWLPEVLEMGFREELLSTEYTLQDYPELPELKLVQEVELTAEDMEKILRASDFISKDMTRPVLTGVAVKGNKIYGTDGYKLYRNSIENELSEQVIIPTECIKVLKAVKAGKRNWTLDVYDDGDMSFTSGNITIYSKIIEGSLPMYDQLLENTEFDTQFTLDLKTLHVPKDYIILVNREDMTISVADKDDRRKNIVVDNAVGIGEGHYQNADERNVVMPLIGSDTKKYVELDPALLKPYGKHTIKMYRNKNNNQVEVEIIK